MESKKSVGIWIRVSTDIQAQGDSPEHHEKRARIYAEVKGWDVYTVYHLEAVSGKSVMQHPETIKMLRDIKEGSISGLIFSKLARLARNTKELLEFSDIFRDCNADLISLQESIDTSTPAGRLFYTLMAAMAQWEREEIVSRITASIPIRAKLGKNIGGNASFGYRWQKNADKSQEIVIDPSEGPIRKFIYELFAEHKRVKAVARLLNEKGYRTRNGSKFTNTTVARLLQYPMAKGQRLCHHTKTTGEGRNWTLKPEEEWLHIPCPALVSEELWNTCNQILGEQHAGRKPRSRPTVQLFSGFLTCQCGGKMYVPSRTLKYVCNKCKKTRIDQKDIEDIYFENLKSFLLTKQDLETFQFRANEAIQSKETELQTSTKEKERVKSEMDKLIQLHLKNQIPTDTFGSYFEPLDIQYKQLIESIATTLGHLDFLKLQQLNGAHILGNAENLYERWPQLELPLKRKVVEELTQSITIGKEDITIKFGFTPNLFQNAPKREHDLQVVDG